MCTLLTMFDVSLALYLIVYTAALPEPDRGTTPLVQALGSPAPDPPTLAQVSERAVYFDILGLVMLTYRDSAARLLHAVPAALALGQPLLIGASSARSAPGSTRSGGSGNNNPLGPAYAALAGGALRTLCSILLAVGLPVLLGVGRTLLSGGRPPTAAEPVMSWPFRKTVPMYIEG